MLSANIASRQQQQQQHQRQLTFLRDHFRKRTILLHLLSHELDHLYTLHNPFNLASLALDRLDVALGHLKLERETPDRHWAELVRCAWAVAPPLAVCLPGRFAGDAIAKEVQSLVKGQPQRVLHIAQACVYLATEQNILNDSIELTNLLIWCQVPALVVSVGLFCAWCAFLSVRTFFGFV